MSAVKYLWNGKDYERLRTDTEKRLEEAYGSESVAKFVVSSFLESTINDSRNKGDMGGYTTYLLPMSAMGGTLTGFAAPGAMLQNCEAIISPIEDVDFAITVYGDSMAPEYPSGSRILIKKINPNIFIDWGKTYVLDTANGVIVKELHECKGKEGYVKCHSVNPDPKFSDFDVPLSEVYGVYRVLMCMSANNMSFFINLAKGFIRSAVNQVGRDGGRVISNKLYGNSHSTPIRNVSSTDSGVYIDNLTSEPISNEDLRIRIKEEGFKISYSISDMGLLLKIWGYILGVISSAILYAICPILITLLILVFWWFIIMKYRMSMVSAYRYGEIGVYTQDRRYRTGKRLAGYKKQKISFLVPASEYEKKIILYICIFYTVLSVSMSVCGYFYMIFSKH